MVLEIGGHEITVELKSRQSMKSYYGYFDQDSSTIALKKCLPIEQRRPTLSHEVFHVFLYLTGYNEILKDISPSTEEALTRAFELHLGEMLIYPEDLEEWLEGADVD